MASGKKKKKFSWFKFWIILIPGFFGVNWCYQAINKPAEIVGLFDSHFYKNPASTWEVHGDLFKDHATPVMTPEFLAALAQAETQGNPIARTYWQWKFSTNPFEIYSPASSATGLFQITDGTFEKTKRFCIHDGSAVKDECWFNFLYSRIVPSHAIEMTSAYLHWTAQRILEKFNRDRASIRQKQDLATVIHLCGPQRGERFARRGFKFLPGEKCSAHNPKSYLTKVQNLIPIFTRLRQGPQQGQTSRNLIGFGEPPVMLE